MYSTVYSGALCGIGSVLVQVEADVAQGLPCFELVGCLSSEAKEARERVRVALKNTGFELPPMRMTVNLSPADVRKEGTGFDLPIAAALLAALGYLDKNRIRDMLLIGELGLNGEVKKVRGVLPIVLEAREKGIRRGIVPAENADEGAIVPGEIEIAGITHITELAACLKVGAEGDGWMPVSGRPDLKELLRAGQTAGQPDFSDIVGQETVKRAGEIAAAGAHHMLLIGPPGAGKTMVGSRMPGILPAITEEEALEISAVYSASGLLGGEEKLVTKRPFRNPHHTITEQALSGGGRIPRPGEISLAHRGILFLDELPEFKRSTLDILRQPLEEKRIHIARSYGTYTFPADFILVCAMNPCPCGYYPDSGRCSCSETEVKRYLSRVSGPVLDRIDICAEAPAMGIRELYGGHRTESSEAIKERVLEARERQRMRYLGSGYRFNKDVGAGDIRKYFPLGSGQERMLEKLFGNGQLSARSYHRILKVARTIADLAGSGSVEEIHLVEAAFYKAGTQKYWRK